MKNQVSNPEYNKLLEQISAAYEKTRLSIVRMYWNIGKYIHQVEQKHISRNIIVNNLIRRLSADLMGKYGKGFSVTNLNNMRNFHKMYSFDQISDRLEWSNYVTLLAVKDDEKRREFEARAVDEGLNYRELKKIVDREYSAGKNPGKKTPADLGFQRGLLHTYTLMDPSRFPGSQGSVVVDCGFNIWKRIPVKDLDKFQDVTFVRTLKNMNSYTIEPAGETDPSLIFTYKGIHREDH